MIKSGPRSYAQSVAAMSLSELVNQVITLGEQGVECECLDTKAQYKERYEYVLAFGRLVYGSNYFETAVDEACTATKNHAEKAKQDWNAEADQFNQWDTLGADEQKELIAAQQTEI